MSNLLRRFHIPHITNGGSTKTLKKCSHKMIGRLNFNRLKKNEKLQNFNCLSQKQLLSHSY